MLGKDMEKQKKIATSDLIDAKRRGTIIIGNYRCGSHFVQNLIIQECLNKKISPVRHQEIGAYLEPTQSWQHVLDNQIADLALDVRYHVMIVNHANLKHDLLCTVNINDWHLVRITSHDKYRWFQSLYLQQSLKVHGKSILESLMAEMSENLSTDHVTDQANVKTSHARLNGRPVLYVGSSDGGRYYDQESLRYLVSWTAAQGQYKDQAFVDHYLGRNLPKEVTNTVANQQWHHNVPRSVYDRYLDQATVHEFDLRSLYGHMANHWLSQQIAVDLELDYKDLPALATAEIKWTPNDYPDDDLVSKIRNGRVLKEILNLWKDHPGKFKKTS